MPMSERGAAPSEADRLWLRCAVELAWCCPPSETAFSVGAVLVDADGRERARGFSREDGGSVHAEQATLSRVGPERAWLTAATLYSSLEPCSHRSSFPYSCTELILAAGVGRVVYALREPAVFARGEGTRQLASAGVRVLRVDALAEGVRRVNAHLVE